MFNIWSKNALTRVKWAVEDLKNHENQVRSQLAQAVEARAAAIAELSTELKELRDLHV